MKPDTVTIIDAEFCQPSGSVPVPHIVVCQDLPSARQYTWRADQPGVLHIPHGPKNVLVAFGAAAEGACLLQLGLPSPANIIDLHHLFCKRVNTHRQHYSSSLLAASSFFDITHGFADEKAEMQALAQSAPTLDSPALDRLRLYCEEDVRVTANLFDRLSPSIDWPRDLIAGRYTGRAVPAMEREGIPMDLARLNRVVEHWQRIQVSLRNGVSKDFPVWVDGVFSHRKFEGIITRLGLNWPRTETGRLCIDRETLGDQARLHPFLRPLVDAFKALSHMRKIELAIGKDGRNRTSLRPYASITGRNQPSATKFVFGPAKWIRGLIKPPAGYALVELDYAQQEFLIAGALSGDKAMLAAYASGDPYLFWAVLAGEAPRGATASTHSVVREIFKVAMLALQYGSTEHGLAIRVGGLAKARKLIQEHRRAFPQYWAWTRAVQESVPLHKAPLYSPLGWRIGCRHVDDLNLRSVVNWPIQAAGADVMRLAAIAMTDRHIPVAAPIHDGFLLVVPEEDADDMSRDAKHLMVEASKAVVGEPCRVEARRFRSGERYSDSKGEAFYRTIMGHLSSIEGGRS